MRNLFHKSGIIVFLILSQILFSQPTTAPNAPTAGAQDVVSIYSDAYTDVPAIWNPNWGTNTTVVEDVVIANNNVKKYTLFNFSGLDFGAAVGGGTIDASFRTHIRLDYWTEDATSIKIKLVDYGADDAWGNDNISGISTSNVLTTNLGTWTSIDVDLNEMALGGLTTRANIGQMVLEATVAEGATAPTVYFDNIYFFGAPPTSPLTVPAPPTMAATDVISIYSDSYTDIATNYSPNWGQDPVINPTYLTAGDAANNVLAYTGFTFQGTELTATDASTMDFLHIDVWVAAGTDRLLKVSPLNNATGGTGVVEILVNVPLTPGAWNSIDIPKSDFTGMTWDNVFQLKFDGQFNGDGSANTTGYDVYLDNIYFWDVYVPDAPVVIHDFNTPEGATSVASGGEWTQFDETDNTANYISLAQLSAADAPGVDSPVMSADYGVIGMIDANGESQWGGYTAMQDKFETVQDLTGYTHLSFKFYNNMPPTGSVGDSLELRVVLWDVSNVTGDYSTRADVETWYAFFKTGIGESPFQNATADGWVEYKIPLLNNGSTGDNMGYRNGFSFPGVGWGISQAGNSQLDLDKIGGMHFELVIVGDGETAQGNFLIEDIQAIYSNEIPGCMNVTSCNYNPEATVDDGSCYDCVDVTFNLDMKNVIGYTENDQPYLAGGTFGAPGSPDAALTYNADLSQNGHLVFSKVVQFRENQTFTYTYSKNNDPNWGGKENIADQDCAVGTYNDRSLTTTSVDSVINACYGNCTDNAFCPAVDIVNVTFSVNMADVPNHLAPTIAGASFPAPGITMTDADNDGIYVTTVQKNEGELLIYKFANGPAPVFDTAPWETVPTECSYGTYGDRNYTVPMSVADVAVDTVCFSSCTNCIEDYPVDVTFNLDMRG
ncbi:MAG: hypothetical protein P8O00_09050, partial [Candidatus Marinimicrobia bacterium]|nr:hypothetical protein [Candidatus Neomarinimicrobiota bacterium]